MANHDSGNEEGMPAPKRRVVTDEFGRMKVIISPVVQKRSESVDDLEYLTMSESEQSEFDFVMKRPGGKRSIGSTTESESGSYQSVRSNITPAQRAAAMKEGMTMAMQLEEAYSTHRKSIFVTKKFDTPLAVLHDLAAKYKQVVHYEYHEVRVPNELSRFLVEVYVGSRKGYGEASTKTLAKQMGAAHLLRKLEKLKKYNIPPYYLIPGCRISPRIFVDLYVLCEVLDVQKPMYIIQPKDPMLEDGPLFTVKCQVGTMISLGESDCFIVARRLAAKNAFESLSGKDVPLDLILSGLACTALVDAGIKTVTSDLKRAVLKHRMVSYLKELEEQQDSESVPQWAVPSVKQERDVDVEFTEDMDRVMDMNQAGQQNYFGGLQRAQNSKARVNKIVESMTEDVKFKINQLRISDKRDQKKEGPGR